MLRTEDQGAPADACPAGDIQFLTVVNSGQAEPIGQRYRPGGWYLEHAPSVGDGAMAQ
ncbi:hypothetical protein ACFWRG_34200 [Micromonospora tulbaghiae]|uniref:hypothetical protein n=1 Tax=Micromonospora tulbaghiae TaxID=479978 RepID=UPI00364F3B33